MASNQPLTSTPEDVQNDTISGRDGQTTPIQIPQHDLETPPNQSTDQQMHQIQADAGSRSQKGDGNAQIVEQIMNNEITFLNQLLMINMQNNDIIGQELLNRVMSSSRNNAAGPSQASKGEINQEQVLQQALSDSQTLPTKSCSEQISETMLNILKRSNGNHGEACATLLRKQQAKPEDKNQMEDAEMEEVVPTQSQDQRAQETSNQQRDYKDNDINAEQVIAKNPKASNNESWVPSHKPNHALESLEVPAGNCCQKEAEDQTSERQERPQGALNLSERIPATAFQGGRTAQAVADGCSINTHAAIISGNQGNTSKQGDSPLPANSGPEDGEQPRQNPINKASNFEFINQQKISNQNQNSILQPQRTLTKSLSRTNMQASDKLNTVLNSQSMTGKSLVNNSKSDQDAHRVITERPSGLTPQETQLQQIQAKIAAAQPDGNSTTQIGQSNSSGPSLINQLMTMLNNRQNSGQAGLNLSAPHAQEDPQTKIGAGSPLLKPQDQSLRQSVLKLNQIQSSNQKQFLAQVIQNAQQKNDKSNKILEEKMLASAVLVKSANPPDAIMTNASNDAQGDGSSNQAHAMKTQNSISLLNNLVQNQQQQEILQKKGFKTLPNTFSDDDFKSLIINNSTVSACNGSGDPVSSGDKVSGSHQTEQGFHGSGQNSNSNSDDQTPYVRSTNNIRQDQSDKMIFQGHLNKYKQQLLNQINNTQADTSMLQSTPQGLQSKSPLLNMQNSSQQSMTIQQKIQMYKEQIQNGQTIQGSQSNTQKLMPQQQMTKQVLEQHFSQLTNNKINFNSKSLKQQESNLSTIGGQTGASDSNLTTLMSSTNQQQQMPPPSISKINFSPPKQNASNQYESLQTQIKQLILLLGVVNNNCSQQNQPLIGNSRQASSSEPSINSIESALKNSLQPAQMKAILEIPGLNNLLSVQRAQQNSSVSTQPQQNIATSTNTSQLGSVLNQLVNKPQISTPQMNPQSGSQDQSSSQVLQLWKQLQSQLQSNQQSGISNQLTQNANIEQKNNDLSSIQSVLNARGQPSGNFSQLSQQLKQISQLQSNLGSGAPQISNQALVQAIQAIQAVQSNGRTSQIQSSEQSNILGQTGPQPSTNLNLTQNQQNLTNQISQISKISQMLGAGNGPATQESLSKLAGVLQAANRNAPTPVLNMMEITGKQPSNQAIGGIVSSDINALKDMVWDDDEDHINKPGQSIHEKLGLDKNQFAPLDLINPRSKGIKKSIDRLSCHQSFGQLQSDALMSGMSDGYGSSAAIFRGNEKVQDKGDYFLIHRLNNQTKRMNQILQCKKCPLKFPKLCNLRDHLRIHNDDMPFKCNLCSKPFTQAGNRDRHEKKRVCLKRGAIQVDAMGNEIYNTEEQSDYQTDQHGQASAQQIQEPQQEACTHINNVMDDINPQV